MRESSSCMLIFDILIFVLAYVNVSKLFKITDELERVTYINTSSLFFTKRNTEMTYKNLHIKYMVYHYH